MSEKTKLPDYTTLLARVRGTKQTNSLAFHIEGILSQSRIKNRDERMALLTELHFEVSGKELRINQKPDILPETQLDKVRTIADRAASLYRRGFKEMIAEKPALKAVDASMRHFNIPEDDQPDLRSAVLKELAYRSNGGRPSTKTAKSAQDFVDSPRGLIPLSLTS
ncbi:MAG TPA: hypothetical protein VMU07_03895 [Candidatus Paceibacterota bacterium]|nr:hypothetical protein [Candidatus Paceibacterota bacterium]